MSSNTDERFAADDNADATVPTAETAPADAEAGGESFDSGSAEPAADDGSADDGASADTGDSTERPEAEPNGNGISLEAAPESDGAPDRVTDVEPFVEDGRADRALDFVVDVLTCMGLDCTVDLMENGDDDPPSDIRIEVSGRDSDRLVGKKGQTLAALQFLVNRVVNRPPLQRRHILLDAGGYRARRESALSSMALRLGQQAADEGKIITFEPMSAQDRRVVHLALAKFAGVVTKSEGKGATRRVQIIPVRD